MKVTNMLSTRTNAKVANQFIITDTIGETFQSYRSLIAYRTYECVVTLDEVFWNYSRTTSKYLAQFLGETTKEIQRKVADGTYSLANLNA